MIGRKRGKDAAKKACQRDFGTPAMLSMLLAVGAVLDAWTKQRSLSSLGENLALDVYKAWIIAALHNLTTISISLIAIMPYSVNAEALALLPRRS